MHEITLRPITEAELDLLTLWVRPGCLLSLLFHKNPKDPFIRAINADIAAGQVQVVKFAAIACAHGPEWNFFVLADGAGCFLYLDGETLNDVEYIGDGPSDASPPPIQDSAGFPSCGEVICAPRSGVVLALKLDDSSVCDCERELGGEGYFFQCMVVKSSWECLADDLSAAADSRLG